MRSFSLSQILMKAECVQLRVLHTTFFCVPYCHLNSLYVSILSINLTDEAKVDILVKNAKFGHYRAFISAVLVWERRTTR